MRTRCVRQHKNGLRWAAAAAVLRADCASAAAPQSLKHSFTLVCVKQIFFLLFLNAHTIFFLDKISTFFLNKKCSKDILAFKFYKYIAMVSAKLIDSKLVEMKLQRAAAYDYGFVVGLDIKY